MWPIILTGIGSFALGYAAASGVFGGTVKGVGQMIGTLPHWPYNYGADPIQFGDRRLVIGKNPRVGTLPHWPYNYGADPIQFGDRRLVIGS